MALWFQSSLCIFLFQNGVRYEVRRYDAAKYASISSEGRSYDQVTGELVRKLLMYIGGSNEQGNAVYSRVRYATLVPKTKY